MATELRAEMGKSMRCRVMFVDDEDAIAGVAEQIFPHFDIAIDVFRNPLDAVAALERDPRGYDVLVTDQSMPEMSGMELIERARSLCPNLPVILCTGLADQREFEELLNPDCSMCVGKPYSFRAISEFVVDLAERRIDL